MSRASKDEMAASAAVRALRGGEKPRPNPVVLTDASGRPLARALEEKGGFGIEAGGERFAFSRRSLSSRRFDLIRKGGATPLGSAGQKSLFSTHLTADLPPEVPEWLQAFLLALLYDKTFVELDRSSVTSG